MGHQAALVRPLTETETLPTEYSDSVSNPPILPHARTVRRGAQRYCTYSMLWQNPQCPRLTGWPRPLPSVLVVHCPFVATISMTLYRASRLQGFDNRRGVRFFQLPLYGV
jgi:hypothetical protein